jgi:hypothetical protein
MSPASVEELKLHKRLVDGDPTASAELYDRYAEGLVEDLAVQYDRIAAHDRGLVSSAVTDAVLNLIAHPARYRPGAKNLRGYLRMSAVGDLLNLWRRVPRPEKAGRVKSLDELVERGMCPACDVVGRRQELDVYHDPVRAVCRAWRRLVERAPDRSPAKLVQILDESVALASKSGNSIVGVGHELDPAVPGVEILRRLWRRVRELVPDRGERQAFVLMLCGVRETGAYARTLQIAHLPWGEQRKEVKRVKDRLVKRLRRADWRGFTGKTAG